MISYPEKPRPFPWKRTLIFWMWNAPLCKEEIARQIREMHSKNIGGFFLHPMPEEFRSPDFPQGMPSYLSPGYFQMVRYAVECAAEYGMDVWLYDEGGWPSGTVNGKLLQQYPHLAMRSINGEGKYIYTANRPDLLNRKVTEYFLENVHEKYRQWVGDFFGKVIPGIFTDEPFFGMLKAPDLVPFSPVLEERFLSEKKYSAREAALNILHGNDPQARQDLNEIWNKLILENYLIPIKEWCRKNDLLFTGHFGGDDCIDNMEQLLCSNIFSLLDQLDVPGCDAIWRQIHPLTEETDFSRITASAAGGKMTISETFAVYGADLSLAEMKQIAAMQFMAGIQIVAPMALHYSEEEGRQITTVSNFYSCDPRWKNFQFYSDFAGRMSKVSDRTIPAVKCHVPFPVTALQRGECSDRNIFGKGLALAKKQITYDYLADAPETEEDPTPDILLRSPCPALRTRHLFSPRGERRIFVNSGTETIEFSFTAPEGFLAWYDPSTGKHFIAYPDERNFLSCKLPFAGCMVLLTIPGKKPVQKKQEKSLSEYAKLDFRFTGTIKQLKASPGGLVEISTEDAKENSCGTKRYETSFSISQKRKLSLVLPNAKRGICELSVNGRHYGTKVWQPYIWELELPAGNHSFTIEIHATPDAALKDPQHLQYLQKNKYDNRYFKKYMAFETLFPDENALDGAFLVWEQK